MTSTKSNTYQEEFNKKTVKVLNTVKKILSEINGNFELYCEIEDAFKDLKKWHGLKSKHDEKYLKTLKERIGE